jgi:hypothetical protein
VSGFESHLTACTHKLDFVSVFFHITVAKGNKYLPLKQKKKGGSPRSLSHTARFVKYDEQLSFTV